MENIRLEIYNTYFSLKIAKCDLKQFLQHSWNFLNDLTLYKYEFCPRTKRRIKVHFKTIYGIEEYSGYTRYLFPKALLPQVIFLIKKAFAERELSIKDFVFPMLDIPIAHMTCELKPEFKLRDYQLKCLSILADKSIGNFALIDLRTGMGKSIIGTFSLFNNKYRTGIVVLPKYIEKWIDDILKYTTAKREDFYVVQGLESLRSLVEEIDSGKNYDFIIFSLRTLYNFHKEDTDICAKEDLFNRLKIGTILSDESHQETAALFTACMYSNVKQVIGMSATYITNQREEQVIQDLLFPPECRISNLTKYNRYIDIVNVKYEIDRRFRVKYKSQHGYSHILFEQSLIGNPKMRERYFDLILYCIKDDYLKRRVKGDKCLIFMSTVSGCTRLTEYLKHKLKEEKLDIKRYTQDDPYDNIMTADICCSTMISSGVAIDIPNLIQIVQTITMGSPKANIQAIGRLRALEGKETKFYKLVSKNIKRQNEIHREALKSYESIASTVVDRNYDRLLTTFITPQDTKSYH